MSYAYTQRKKTVRRMKKRFPKNWQQQYGLFIDEIRSKKDGPCIGSLQEIMDAQKNAVVIR